MKNYSFLSIFYYSVLCLTDDNRQPATSIRHDLLWNYDRLNRPVRKLTTVTSVLYDAYLYQLVGFNSKEQSIELLIFQFLIWHDEFLEWDPANYSGIEQIRVFQNQIWIPDVLPYNEIGNFDYNKFGDIVPLTVKASGQVIWSQPVNMETSCSMDVTNFPFDSQSCEIAVGSWQYYKDELKMYCKDELNLSEYMPDSLWVLQGLSDFFSNGEDTETTDTF